MLHLIRLALSTSGKRAPAKPEGRVLIRVVYMRKATAQVLFFILGMVLILHSGAYAGSIPQVNTGGYNRIISLAPSITETLFALGLGDRVVGVTRYCLYPPEACTKPKVGGYTDPNYEEIMRLHPDLIIIAAEHTAIRSTLQSMHIRVLQVNHNTIQDILNSITIIGDICGVNAKADSLKGELLARIKRTKAATQDFSRPRVLVSVGRAMGSISELCIAGKNTYYDDMIEIAGGINSMNAGRIAFPMISLESIYQVNPQVVIDMVPLVSGSNVTQQAVLSEWKKVAKIDAVRNGRVYVFVQDFAEIPGPRFIDILEQMAKVLHPELKSK